MESKGLKRFYFDPPVDPGFVPLSDNGCSGCIQIHNRNCVKLKNTLHFRKHDDPSGFGHIYIFAKRRIPSLQELAAKSLLEHFKMCASNLIKCSNDTIEQISKTLSILPSVKAVFICGRSINPPEIYEHQVAQISPGYIYSSWPRQDLDGNWYVVLQDRRDGFSFPPAFEINFKEWLSH